MEQLELILADERDMKLSSLVDLAAIESTFALVQRQNKTQRADVVLIDWDGDSADNMQLLEVAGWRRVRCLVLTWQVMPSDIAAYRQAGAWGCVSTRVSSRHLLIALRHVAQGKMSFPPAVVLAPISAHRASSCSTRRFFRTWHKLVGHQLSPTELRIFQRLNEADAVEIARSLDLEPGTIRTELSTNIFGSCGNIREGRSRTRSRRSRKPLAFVFLRISRVKRRRSRVECVLGNVRAALLAHSPCAVEAVQ